MVQCGTGCGAGMGFVAAITLGGFGAVCFAGGILVVHILGEAVVQSVDISRHILTTGTN